MSILKRKFWFNTYIYDTSCDFVVNYNKEKTDLHIGFWRKKREGEKAQQCTTVSKKFAYKSISDRCIRETARIGEQGC